MYGGWVKFDFYEEKSREKHPPLQDNIKRVTFTEGSKRERRRVYDGVWDNGIKEITKRGARRWEGDGRGSSEVGGCER